VFIKIIKHTFAPFTGGALATRNSMKKLILFFLFIPVISNGQILNIFTKYYFRNEIIRMYSKDCKKNNYELSIHDNRDTLVIEVKGVERIILKCTFHSWDKTCDYQELRFFCNPCVETHKADILGYKPCRWKKISENRYLSKYSSQTEMEILTQKTLDPCLIVIFKFIDEPRKKYRKRYNSL